MSDHSVTIRTTAHVLLALLFGVAAVAFSQQAIEAWNMKHSVQMWLLILASLGAVSLCGASLRRALGLVSGPRLGRRSTPPV